jgi:hypothetical protein
MCEMGAFMNEIDVKLQTAFVVFVIVAAPMFGYFYNRLIDSLKSRFEHMSVYVVGGVTITLVFVALLSWKAALLALGIFTLTGLPMIVGEFCRTNRKMKQARRPRRLRLPYAANGILDEAKMASTQAHQAITKAINTNNPAEQYKHMAAAAMELVTITAKIAEVKQIQMEK